VISDDQLVGLDRTQSSELLLPALREIWRWPGLVERLPKRKTATGLTTSQLLRLLKHCAELPAESQTLFTLFWMNESALRVRCSDVTTAASLRTRDPRGDSAGKSHVCDRFATHWNPRLAIRQTSKPASQPGSAAEYFSVREGCWRVLPEIYPNLVLLPSWRRDSGRDSSRG
jgi:hypothetical protein